MNRIKFILIGLLTIAAVGLIAIQFNSIQQLRSELAQVKSGTTPASPVHSDSSVPAPTPMRTDTGLEQRLSDLEKTVAELSRGSRYLMERGQLPVAASVIEDAHRKFMDASLPDRERLRALELLRRNRGMSDEIAGQAVAWLQSSTNSGTQRALLQQLDGMTNATFLQPFMALVSSEDSGVREEAVENLRHFMGDPQVEAKLWALMKSDPDEDVRQQAEEALGRGPFTETRLAALQQRALDPQASLDERLVSIEALNRAGANAQTATAFLADLAQKTTDPDEKLKLFRAFDGMNDPAVKLPLVNGLRDPNPLIREEAVDALSDFRSDPAVEEWLRYVAQNDEDPEVRREAFGALQQRRNVR